VTLVAANTVGGVTSGDVVANYDYDAFGNGVQTTGYWARFNPIRFSTKYNETNGTYAGREVGLVLYPMRVYSPSMGRWLGRDPMGERGGLNLYVYCNNDGSNLCDPYGLARLELFYNLATDIKPPMGTIAVSSWKMILNDIKAKLKENSAKSSESICCVSGIYIYGHGSDGAIYAGSVNVAAPEGDISHTGFDYRKNLQNNPKQVHNAYYDTLSANIDTLYLIKSTMCKNGTLMLISCDSFAGTQGKAFKQDLEGIFGKGNISGFETYVWTGPHGSSTSWTPFSEFFSNIPVPPELREARLYMMEGANIGP
jgi:RHS repeat-associated protein